MGFSLHLDLVSLSFGLVLDLALVFLRFYLDMILASAGVGLHSPFGQQGGERGPLRYPGSCPEGFANPSLGLEV